MGWQRVVVVSLLVVLGALGLLEVMADRLLVAQPLAGVASRSGGAPMPWPSGVSISDDPHSEPVTLVGRHGR